MGEVRRAARRATACPGSSRCRRGRGRPRTARPCAGPPRDRRPAPRPPRPPSPRAATASARRGERTARTRSGLVGDPVDRARVVVGDQERAVLHLRGVDRAGPRPGRPASQPSAKTSYFGTSPGRRVTIITRKPIFFVRFQEPRWARNTRFLYSAREHRAGVELDAVAGHVRARLDERRRELARRSAPCRTRDRGCRPGGSRGSRSAGPSSAPRRSGRSARPRRASRARGWRSRAPSSPGCQSKPTLLRTPCAKYSKPLPSGLTREMLAWVSGGMQMLQGAPMLK